MKLWFCIVFGFFQIAWACVAGILVNEVYCAAGIVCANVWFAAGMVIDE